MPNVNQEIWTTHIKDHRKIIELLIRELYGDDPIVSIREVLQNAHDACKRRVSTDAAPRVTIGLKQDAGQRRIVISDSGVGMTRDELSTKLLAVGESTKSTWEDASDLDTLRQIVSESADEIGKYGIGFLASFILADRVVVTTRKEGAPSTEAWRLDLRLGDGKPPKQVERAEPGTDIELYLRSAGSGNQEFDARVRELTDATKLCQYITEMIYFSTVPIQYDGHQGLNTLSITHPSVSALDPLDLVRLIAHDDSASPVASARVSVQISESDNTDVFLYLWKGNHAARAYRSATIWVRGMLVEYGAADCLPEWADAITAYVVARDLPLELDRRNAQRTSVQFSKLRRVLLEHCCALVSDCIAADWSKFHREVWPTLWGTMLNSALVNADKDSVYVDPEDRRAAQTFIREVGPLLPLRSLTLNPTVNAYYTDTTNLKRIEERLSSGGAKAGPISVPCLATLGTIDTALDPAIIKSPVVIDTRTTRKERDAQVESMKGLLQSVQTHLEGRFQFHEIAPLVGQDVTADEFEKEGWKALKIFVAQLASYGGGVERYNVMVRRFKPSYLPAVAMELSAEDTERDSFNQAMSAVLQQFPQFESLLADARSQLSPDQRLLTLILNADNEVMKELARHLSNESPISRSVPFERLVRHQIEDARIDFYGGAFIGRDTQSYVYAELRNPQYLFMLQSMGNSIDLADVPVQPMERKAVVLMGDLTNSNNLLDPLDRAEWGQVLVPFAERVNRFVTRNGGFFCSFTGDGFLAAWFGDKESGVGGRVRELFQRLSAEINDWSNSAEVTCAMQAAGVPGQFEIRMAVTFGPIQFARFGRAGNLAGKCVVKAARLLEHARYGDPPGPYRIVMDGPYVDTAGFSAAVVGGMERQIGADQQIRNFPGEQRVWCIT